MHEPSPRDGEIIFDYLSDMRSPSRLERELEQAIDNHRAGRLAQAELLYQRVLSSDSRQPKALFGLGSLALQSQRNELAADLLRRAVEAQPDNPKFQTDLGEAYRRLGERRKAVDLLLRALSLDPDFAEAFHNLAMVLRDNGELPGAVIYFERATDLSPDTVAFQLGLAAAVSQLGELARAAGHYICAWLLGGRNAQALPAIVTTLLSLGRTDEAESLRHRHEPGAQLADHSAQSIAKNAHLQALAFEQRGDLRASVAQHEVAAYVQPDSLVHQQSLAHALHEFGATGQAIAHYHCALALAPESVEILISLSTLLKELGRSEGAAATSQRALAVEPESAQAHACLAAARVDQRRNEEAIAICKRAIELDPKLWQAHFQLGNAHVGCGNVEAAIDCYRRTMDLCPAQHVAHSNLLFLLSYVPGITAATIGKEARNWARQRADTLAGEIKPYSNEPNPKRRIRIGYVSPDFNDHSVALFVLPLLEHHDRAGYEAFCYSSVRKPDAVTARIRAGSDGWRDVAGAGDPIVADLIRSDGIDILVDLAMHTGGGRPRLFARKPAPVQICWLAYVGTTGLTTMDYRITDPYLEPPDLVPDWCTEAQLVLPDTFWCYRPFDPAPDVTALPALATGHVTFGSQHSFHKINRAVVALWARVLRAVDASRLVLYAPASAREAILIDFEDEGVEAQRIEFLPLRARRDYLGAYQSIDISLDTFPYNGATTSLDAWYMGVPVLSLLGQTPVGRAGLSIATNIGLPEFVAATEDEYVKIAREITSDLERLGQLRAGLRNRIEQSPLMDAPRFTRHLETAYRNAWATWCKGVAQKYGHIP